MTYDLTDAFAKLDRQLKHNQLCPDGACLDRDDCYSADGDVSRSAADED
jgi:hypothetical protein